jgi:hypothetical protein
VTPDPVPVRAVPGTSTSLRLILDAITDDVLGVGKMLPPGDYEALREQYNIVAQAAEDAMRIAQRAVVEEDARAELNRERRDVFVDCISDYERMRVYMSVRHADLSDNHQVAHWLADNGYGILAEGVPEADEWRRRYWPDPPTPDVKELNDQDIDGMVFDNYLEALAEGEEWALDAYRQNHPGVMDE